MNSSILSVKTSTFLLLIFCLSGCSFTEQTNSAATPESPSVDSMANDETVYLARYKRLVERPPGAGLNLYDPLEAVPGVADYSPLPVVAEGENTISKKAELSTTTYAEQANSTAFIVWRKGKIEFAEYFQGVDRSTPLVSRSLAKPLTMLAVGRAIEQGFIQSLDQPVADFIHEWRDIPKQDILVRHLLDMRSGLLPQARATEPEDVLNRAYLHPRHGEVIINEYPLTHEPGTRYEYSNATSELVAVLIERATNVRYSEWISDQILMPLNAQGGEVWVNREGGLAHSGCCIMLPAETWLRMAILLVQDGIWEGQRLLPAGYVTEARAATPQNPHAGMGVWVAGDYVEWRGSAHPSIPFGRSYHSEPYLAEDLFLFDGNSNQVIYMVPSQDLIVLRLGLRPAKEFGWDNTYLPNTIIRGIKTGE